MYTYNVIFDLDGQKKFCQKMKQNKQILILLISQQSPYKSKVENYCQNNLVFWLVICLDKTFFFQVFNSIFIAF